MSESRFKKNHKARHSAINQYVMTWDNGLDCFAIAGFGMVLPTPPSQLPLDPTPSLGIVIKVHTCCADKSKRWLGIPVFCSGWGF